MTKNYFIFKGVYFKLTLLGLFCLLVAFSPKENENPKKKKAVALAAKTLDPASYLALTVSGFNADVIANGVGALNTTTTNDVDGVNYCYLAMGTQTSGTATPTAYGLPTGGVLNVAGSGGLSFQLASYDANNSLRINQNGAAGESTITFTEANSYEKLHLAVTSGSGASNVTFTVNFSDATTQVISSAAIPDWFNATTLPVIISGIGRGNRTSNTLENPSNNPRIYQLDLNIDAANQSKVVTGITIQKISGGVFNLFAVTGKLVPDCAGPTNIATTAVNIFDAAITWDSANSTDTFEVALVNAGDPIPATGDASATNSYNFSTLTPETTYDVYIRTVCATSGYSFWTGPFSFTTAVACEAPTGVAITSIGANTATVTWDAGTATDWEYNYVPTGDPAPTTGTPLTTTTADLSMLTQNTTYDVYVRSYCGAVNGYSAWTVVTFTTLCDAFGSFSENFDTTAGGAIPNCWANYVNATSIYAAVNVVTFGGYSAPNRVQLYNSSDANAELYLITPSLTDLPNGTHRLKFKVSGGTGYTLIVGTMSNPADNTTFTEIEPFQAPSGFNEYIVDFSGVSTTDTFIAFKHGLGGTYRTIYIDDVVWEPVPTTPPGCASNVVATPDAACGNFANSIDWDATVGADGYYLTIGTTTGGTDVLNNENIGNITSYSFVGDFNTTYYYTLVPFNSFGSATGCTEQSFTTFATGCYCTSVPTSNDGSGITNVQLGTTNFPTGDVTYFDHTATTVTLQQGLNTNVQVSFATGYTYNTYIWIDFNDNLTFEASEIVYSGESLSTNPTILNASFVMPATATLGTHRMRLASADYMPTADPCYSGSYGVTLDFSVDIVVSSCTPASATATVSADCANNQYFVAVDVTALGSGTPSISDGTNTWPVTATGVVQAGPFASGSSVSLTVLHGSDSTCDLPLGTFNYACPPANDDLCNAIALTLNAAATGTDYSLSAATGQTSEPVPSCFSGGINGSVWFSFIAPASGSVNVTTDFTGGSLSDGDTEIAVYDATGVTCSDLTTLGASIGCDQDGGTTVNYSSFLSLNSLTAGNTYYIQVDRYTGTTAGTFGIQVNATLSADSFDNTSFTAYPNPVKDVLNLSYSTEITSVKVINLLGQEVLSRNVGSTSTQVDMSNLTAGAYIVNITVDNVVKSIKVIKQ